MKNDRAELEKSNYDQNRIKLKHRETVLKRGIIHAKSQTYQLDFRKQGIEAHPLLEQNQGGKEPPNNS